MARASCLLSSGLGVGGVAHAVESPLEAHEYAAEARILDSGDATAAGIGDFAIGPSVFSLVIPAAFFIFGRADLRLPDCYPRYQRELRIASVSRIASVLDASAGRTPRLAPIPLGSADQPAQLLQINLLQRWNAIVFRC